jgi:predicted house-cleaning noncanonical NTP pyrophosphatase (MazG superfamily)
MKLIRDKYNEIIDESKLTKCDNDKNRINMLFYEKILEEIREFVESEYSDPNELADTLQVVLDWARFNSFSPEEIEELRRLKEEQLGGFTEFLLLKNS